MQSRSGPPPKTEKNLDDHHQSQSGKFIEAARELGCDATEEEFAAIVRQVASTPPAPADKPSRDKGSAPVVKKVSPG